jgi:hypothetical protein
MQPALNRPHWLLAFAVVITSAACPAQNALSPITPYSAPALSRVEGTDANSGTHYVRLSIPSSAAGTASDLAPRFTLECRDLKGKHNLLWFLSFGGIPIQPFAPPFKASQNDPFPPNYEKVKLRMDFEGYMRSKPVIKEWEMLPSGEFRFCNAGLNCSNMETARFYMGFLNALPTLRIAYAKTFDGKPLEQVFELRSLVDEANKTPVCTP